MKIPRLTIFQIILGLMFFAIVVGVFVFLFRSEKDLTVTVKVSEENVIWPSEGIVDWFSYLFREGMEEKNSLGKTVARVVKVRAYDTTLTKRAVYLTLKIRAVYSPGKKQYSYNGKDVAIGNTLLFTLDNVQVSGFVADIDGFKDAYPEKSLIVDAQMINIDPVFLETEGVTQYLADSVNVGDRILDESGQPVLTVIEKKVEPAKKIVVDQNGQTFIQPHPTRVDVYLILEVKARIVGGRPYLFEDVPVLINSKLPIHTDKVSVWPIITQIREK